MEEHDFRFEQQHCWNGCEHYEEDGSGPGTCNKCNISIIDSQYAKSPNKYKLGWFSIVELLYQSESHRQAFPKCVRYDKIQTYWKLQKIV